MFDYLQKFNTLPASLRDSVSSPAAMDIIAELENKYKIDLASTVMKVMAKIIPLADLSIYFVSDFSLSQETAKKLTAELKERLFFPVANYLGYNASYSSIVPKTAPAPAHLAGVEKVIKEAGVVFAGVELNTRFKTILATYLKGVRSRIDTRITLNKEIISGGLGLDHKVIDKIFKVSDEIIAGQTLPSGASMSLPSGNEQAPTGLDKVRALYEKPGEARDIPYDLKAAISTGAIKKPVTALNLPQPIEASEKLLEEGEEEIKPIVIPVVTKPFEVVTPVTPIKIPVVAPVAPIIPPVVVPIIPVVPLEPKINRPPEKTGLLSNLFHAEAPKQTAQPVVKEVVPPKVTPVAQPSIATLRAEAAAPQKSEFKNTPTQAQIVDIKAAPKVMGPVDELRYLDLVNFRRFGTSPEEATAKVESKIKLLEKDGYDKMVSGVLAWRASIVNSVYLKMGQEALTKGISLKQCADNYQLAKNPNYLVWSEIEAIMALNSRLMF